MKTLFALGALAALAASSQALVIDDFTTGAFNGGYISDPATTYSNTTAASVPGGFRFVSYTKTANPNGEDFRARLNTPTALLMYTTGIEVDGFGELGYGTSSPLNASYSSNPLFQLTVAANDLPTVATLTLTSSTFGTVSRIVNLPVTTTPQISNFNFTGEAALADVDTISFNFDFSPSGDFAVTRFEAVPEPVSIAALATGIGALCLRRRKR